MQEFTKLLSKDGQTTLNCVTWLPSATEKPLAVVQIIHGMAEYIERYADFAHFLTAQRIIVVGHDHLGHGKSVDQTDPLYGYFADSQSENILIEDAYQVTALTKSNYPDLPYFVLGHSMGSFVLRHYLTRYSADLSGALIMGTGSRRPELKLASKLTALLNKIAPKTSNQLLDTLAFGSFAKRFPEKRSAFDWLSKNTQNVDDYLADPLLGFVFTNNGFHTLFTLMAKATEKNWWQGISPITPLYIVSGEQDPVGDFGKGPREVATELTAAGFNNVTLQLYRNLRHELLNETEKETVMSDCYQWLLKQL